MIGNVDQGSGFGGLLRYLYHGDKDQPMPDRVAWTDLHNLSPSDDPNRLAGVMRHTANDHPRKPKNPVIHISVSWEETDRPSEAQMRQVAYQVLQKMDLEDHQAVVVAHRDTDHRHLHIVANQVREDGHVWAAWKSKTRLEAAMRELEREHGFTVVPGRLAPVGERPPAALLTRGEHLEALRKGTTRSPEEQAHVRLELRKRFRGAHSWAQLEDKLGALGLRLKRRGRGLVVTDGQRMVKASRIDRQSSKGKLEERFGQTFESWIEEKKRLRQIAQRISHHQARRKNLDQRFRGVTDPKHLERLNRIKSRVDRTVRLLQGDLAAAYRPIESRLARAAGTKALELIGVPKPPRPSRGARAAVATLNLVSRLLPPVPAQVLKSTIRVADVLVRGRSR